MNDAKDYEVTTPTAEGAVAEADATEQAKPEMVIFNNIDVFAAHLVAWHARKVAQLQHFLSIPAGTAFTVNINGEEQEVKLEGDTLVAFKGGITTALSMFEQLPFAAVPMDAENSEPAAGNTDAD